MDTSAYALELALTHPAAMLPCPFCVASVRGENLARHVDKVHQTEPRLASGQNFWRGAHRGARRIFIAVLIAYGLLFGVTLMVQPHLSEMQGTLLAGGLVLVMAGVLLAVLGVFKATLRLEGDTVIVRSLFGSRQLHISEAIESGGLREKQSSSVVLSGGETWADSDVKVGNYLGLSDGKSSILVGSAKNTGFRKHWAKTDWTPGPARRHWDLTLTPRELVHLEYALAAIGKLSPQA